MYILYIKLFLEALIFTNFSLHNISCRTTFGTMIDYVNYSNIKPYKEMRKRCDMMNQSEFIFSGNHILHHNVFKDWIPAKWMYEFNLHYEFPLEDGKVVIQNPGLYLIYAQVMY